LPRRSGSPFRPPRRGHGSLSRSSRRGPSCATKRRNKKFFCSLLSSPRYAFTANRRQIVDHSDGLLVPGFGRPPYSRLCRTLSRPAALWRFPFPTCPPSPWRGRIEPRARRRGCPAPEGAPGPLNPAFLTLYVPSLCNPGLALSKLALPRLQDASARAPRSATRSERRGRASSARYGGRSLLGWQAARALLAEKQPFSEVASGATLESSPWSMFVESDDPN